MADDETSSTGDAEAGMTGSRAAVARVALEEAQADQKGVAERLAAAEQEVAALERKIADGAEDVTFESISSARHRVEVLSFARDREHNRVQAALRALHKAEAEDVAAGWDEEAPEMRRAIRDAAEALVAADEALFQATDGFNSRAAATAQRLRQLGVPSATVQPLAPISPAHLRQMISKEARGEVAIAASLLPADVVPESIRRFVESRSFARQSAAGHGGATSAANGHRQPVATISDEAAAEAVGASATRRVGRVAWSPFTRRGTEEA